jgi:hypothetical protein
MSKRIFKGILLYIMLTVAEVSHGADPAKISAPGVYSGYAPKIYSEWIRESRYVAVRDGTRLAVDIYRPAVNHQATDQPYPVLWMFTPYRRAFYGRHGEIEYAAAGKNLDIQSLTLYGYVVAVADVRGKGGSFGARRGFQDQQEAHDGYDINEWLAKQPWSNGKVGMFGCSYCGGSQYNVLTTVPPHLKAIFPGFTPLNLYDMNARGGILAQWGTHPPASSDEELATVPVDEDKDGALLKQAVAQHSAGTNNVDLWRELPYRDSYSSLTKSRFWEEASVSTYLKKIENSKVAIYRWSNWQDEESEGIIFGHHAMSNLRKLWIGGWSHCQTQNFDMGVEAHRFFDYWLKGIDNGIMSEPPIYFYTLHANPGDEWRFAAAWPLPETTRTAYYLRGEPMGSVASKFDGTLSTEAPKSKVRSPQFQVDYAVRCKAEPMFWPCSIDASAITYSTAPLTKVEQITGHPVMHLWVTSTATDGNFFVALEDVSADGSVQVLTHGRLKASLRRLNHPPFDTMDLPWHRAYQSDVMPMEAGTPAELIITLEPTSAVIQSGHRLRLTVAGADPREPAFREEIHPAPMIEVLHDGVHNSFVSVPLVPIGAGIVPKIIGSGQ